MHPLKTERITMETKDPNAVAGRQHNRTRAMAAHVHGIATYKHFLLVFLGALTAFGPMVTDMYLPALPSMTEWFGTSATKIQLSLTSCMAGLAIGQLIFGPLSDRYGRKHVLLTTLALFVASTVLCLAAPGIDAFVGARLLQGVAAAGSIVIARSVATDIYTGHELARILAVVGAINGVAPVMAPVIGGTMTETLGWRGIFAILLGLGVVLVASCLLYRESLPAEKRLGGDGNGLAAGVKALLHNRRYVCYTLQMGFAQAALFANISSAPFIMQQHYGFSPMSFSLCFGLNACAVVLSAGLAARFSSMEKVTRNGSAGILLFAACECAALASGCAFWIYEVLMVGMLFSLGLCFTASTAVAMDSGRDYSGCASAMLGAVCFAFGGIVSPLVGMGDPMLSTGIVFVASALCSAACVLAAGRKA